MPFHLTHLLALNFLSMADPVAARFVTTARLVTKRAAMPAHFVTNEVVTNRAGIALFFFFLFFFSLGYQYM